jgi:adenylate cyclase
LDVTTACDLRSPIAQLVETSSGHTVWAPRFDREMADVFEVQDEIARSIAQAFRIPLLFLTKSARPIRPRLRARARAV